MSGAVDAILQPVERIDWAVGDIVGLAFPAHSDALRTGGAAYLTRAFHATGALPPDNAVIAIDRLDAWRGGATGTKAALAVRYAAPTDLPTELFVKFSRAFDDPIRDRMRFEMAAEVRFAAVSRAPGFPVRIPRCLFADFAAASGTGILMTERVPYGERGIEPHRPKCMDYAMPDAIGHYRVLIDVIATLAGASHAGSLPPAITACFGFDRAAAAAANPMPPVDRFERHLARLPEFARTHPQMLPPEVADGGFLARFADEARIFAENAPQIAQFLFARPDFIALCHWNANIDNAWFWRERADADAGDGETTLRCGLMDWGGVGRMTIAQTLWGCLCGGETTMWRDHLDPLIARFAGRYHAAGGPAIAVDDLALHFRLYVAMMMLAHLLDTPAWIARLGIDLAPITGRRDPRFAAVESARNRLLMLTNVLDLWRRGDMRAAMRCAIT